MRCACDLAAPFDPKGKGKQVAEYPNENQRVSLQERLSLPQTESPSKPYKVPLQGRLSFPQSKAPKYYSDAEFYDHFGNEPRAKNYPVHDKHGRYVPATPNSRPDNFPRQEISHYHQGSSSTNRRMFKPRETKGYRMS